MMHLLIIIVYGFLCCLWLTKMPFVRKSGIPCIWLVGLFILHVATGWVHNAIAWRYFPNHGDVWNDFRLSFLYRHRLFSQFDLFVSDNDTWTHFSHNSTVYVQMLLNVLSGGRMDVNTLLFAFPVFLGSIALYRTFQRRFPDNPLPAASVVLLPSILFWTSVIHREGMLYMVLGFLLYQLDQWFTSPALRRVTYCVLLFLLIAYIRPAVAFTLIPAVYAWWYLERPACRKRLLLVGAILLGLALALSLTIPSLNIPKAIAARQNEFYQLEGHSRLSLPALDGSWLSLIHALPAAALNGLFEPLPGTGGQPIYLAFALELLATWVIVLTAIIRRRLPPPMPTAGPHAEPKSRRPLLNPFGIFCLIFALTGMLTIGMIIPFAGAIVRYRSIYLPFLLAPFLNNFKLKIFDIAKKIA